MWPDFLPQHCEVPFGSNGIAKDVGIHIRELLFNHPVDVCSHMHFQMYLMKLYSICWTIKIVMATTIAMTMIIMITIIIT